MRATHAFTKGNRHAMSRRVAKKLVADVDVGVK